MTSTSSASIKTLIRGRKPEAFRTNNLDRIANDIPRDLSPKRTAAAVTNMGKKRMDGTNMVGIVSAFIQEALKKKGQSLEKLSQAEVNSFFDEVASEHPAFKQRIETVRAIPFHAGSNGLKDENALFRGNSVYKVNQNIMADSFGVTIPFHISMKEKERIINLLDNPVTDLYVAPSTIPQAGKGLFSGSDLQAGQDIELMHHIVIKKGSPEDKTYKGMCHILGEHHKKYAGEFVILNHQQGEFQPTDEFYTVLCDGARYLNNAANVRDDHYEQDPQKETGMFRRQLGIVKQQDIPQSLEGLSEAIIGLPCLVVNPNLPSGAVTLPKDSEIMYSYSGDRK